MTLQPPSTSPVALTRASTPRSSSSGFSLLSLLITGVGIGACAPRYTVTQLQEDLHASLQDWRGADRDLLVRVWGPPSGSADLSDKGSVLQYTRGKVEAKSTPAVENQGSPGEHGGARPTWDATSVQSRDCTILFTISQDGRTIEGVEERGSLDVCAELVRPRPTASPTRNGYDKSGSTISWEQNHIRISQEQNMQALPPPGPNASAPLTGKFKLVRLDCWKGARTEMGRVMLDAAVRSLERYVLDFDARVAESKTGACVQRERLEPVAHEGRWRVHFTGGSAEGCAPLPDMDRTMELDPSGVLLDFAFGTPAQIAQFCASGAWVQVFERIP